MSLNWKALCTEIDPRIRHKYDFPLISEFYFWIIDCISFSFKCLQMIYINNLNVMFFKLLYLNEVLLNNGSLGNKQGKDETKWSFSNVT
jgi:hypothetical protein